MSIISFKSRQELTCENNLTAFIRRAKNELKIYECDGGFGSITWYRIRKGGVKDTIAFTQLISKKGKSDGAPFKQPFLDFARAYVREQQSINEVAPAPMMSALKAIYYGLIDIHDEPNILLLDNPTVIKAREAIEARNGAESRYGIGGHLVKLLKWLKDNRIGLNHTVLQNNPWKKQNNRAEGTSDRDRSWQEDRLMTSHQVCALADTFAMAKSPYEIFWSSCAVLLMFAPSRAGELHFLGTDCLFETVGMETKLNPTSGKIEEKEFTVLNLRWKAAKGGGTIPKPVHPRLEHTVRDAVAQLHELGVPARDAARWAVKNPDKFYRHGGCMTGAGHDEDAPLNYEELCAALCLKNTAKTRRACLVTDTSELGKMAPFMAIWVKKLFKGKSTITYRDLAKDTVEKYSKGYPNWPNIEEVNLPVYDALCLIQENQFHTVSLPKAHSFISPGVNLFNGALGSAESRSDRGASMFDMLGITDERGAPMKITTHQIRAWLSTMAERGEMDSFDLALFAGRKRIEDNRAYDLRTQEERRSAARAVLNAPLEAGLRIIKSVEINVPVTFKSMGHKDRVGACQCSGYGICEHDWSMSPCTKAGDCVGCSEHACVKGLPKSLERLRKLESAQAVQFERARDAQDSGEYGADAWVIFLGKRLAVTRTIVRMYEDGNIPDGTIIRIPKELDPTETQVALTAKGLKTEVLPGDEVSRSIIKATQSEFLALMGD
jgi:hypothetical protein